MNLSPERQAIGQTPHIHRPCLFALLLACMGFPGNAAAATADSDAPVQTLATERGVYRVTIRPETGSVPIAEMHNWIVHVETTAGSVFVPAQLVFMAGMPAHGHGTPAQPVITRFLGEGDFLVEGVKFNMTGLWHIVVNVTGPAGPDSIRFEMNLRNAPMAVDAVVKDWTRDELRVVNSLRLASLRPLPRDFTNRFSGNPDAIELGQALFFDRNLSASGKTACADCHEPARHFTDGKVLSFGSRQTARHSPSLIGVAYSQWFYWDGRRDSMWSQSVTPIETPGEMDMTRVDAVRFVMTHDAYRPLFGSLSSVLSDSDIEDQTRFPAGAGPYGEPQGQQEWQLMAKEDQVAVSQAFADIGKTIAVYVETLQPELSRFDQFADELVQGNRRAAYKILDKKERAGLKLFIDQDRLPCLRCHNGPQLTNHEFHNVATGFAGDGTYDFGRYVGLQAALVDEFNCRGQFSDATREQCDRLKYAAEGHADQGAFKVPTLRNVGETAPYMHDGRFDNLREVIEHYRDVPPVTEVVHEVPQFRLTDKEIVQLVAFLETLTAKPSSSGSNPLNTR